MCVCVCVYNAIMYIDVYISMHNYSITRQQQQQKRQTLKTKTNFTERCIIGGKFWSEKPHRANDDGVCIRWHQIFDDVRTAMIKKRKDGIRYEMY